MRTSRATETSRRECQERGGLVGEELDRGHQGDVVVEFRALVQAGGDSYQRVLQASSDDQRAELILRSDGDGECGHLPARDADALDDLPIVSLPVLHHGSGTEPLSASCRRTCAIAASAVIDVGSSSASAGAPAAASRVAARRRFGPDHAGRAFVAGSRRPTDVPCDLRSRYAANSLGWRCFIVRRVAMGGSVGTALSAATSAAMNACADASTSSRSGNSRRCCRSRGWAARTQEARTREPGVES